MLPAPSKVMFLLEAVIELLDATFKVKVFASDCICAWADIVIWPDNVLFPDVDLITPLLLTPDPEIVIASATLIPPKIFKAAAFATVVAPSVAPKPAALEMAKTPLSTEVVPV